MVKEIDRSFDGKLDFKVYTDRFVYVNYLDRWLDLTIHKNLDESLKKDIFNEVYILEFEGIYKENYGNNFAGWLMRTNRFKVITGVYDGGRYIEDKLLIGTSCLNLKWNLAYHEKGLK